MADSLYNIIKALQEASGSNAKLAILKEHKDNELLKAYLEATLSPRYNYYITEKTLPAFPRALEDNEIDEGFINHVIQKLAGREATGHAAKAAIVFHAGELSAESQELFRYLLLKDIKASVGVTLVNKVWPNLIPEQPYMRCSLPKDVKLSGWPWEQGIYSQVKADGMYVAGSKGQLITRAGSVFPKGSFPELEKELEAMQDGKELNGELLVFNGKGEMLPRKIGNGMLNSVLQGGSLDKEFKVVYQVWDYMDLWITEFNKFSYSNRLAGLQRSIKNTGWKHIELIETKLVRCQQEAAEHFQQCLTRGLEGTVLKHPEGLWKDGTSKHCVKYKVEAEIDLRVTGIIKGTGKFSDSMGALELSSECWNVKVDCGTGFTDKQRKDFWENKPKYFGSIVTIKANDIVTRSGSDIYSLFLPVFVEERLDKTEADSFEKIKDIFDSVKGLK